MAVNHYTLAAVYIVKDEAENLKRSLLSVRHLVDEIIVLDSGSTDQTERVCSEYGVRFHRHLDWQGFGLQRQRAQGLATSDWILMLDADEAISQQLGKKILEVKRCPPTPEKVYALRRKDLLFGECIDPSNWFVPVKAHRRLYPARYYHFCNSRVHESLICHGAKVTVLDGYLLHHTAATPEAWLTKRLGYAEVWALERAKKGKTASAWAILGHLSMAFIKQYFIYGRFLRGRIGLLYAVMFSGYVFNKYAMLYDLSRKGLSSRASKETV